MAQPNKQTNKTKQKNYTVGEDVEKREPLYTVDGNVNWCNHYGKQYGGTFKNKNRTTT